MVTKESHHEEHSLDSPSRLWKFIQLIWTVGFGIGTIYLVVMYLLPIMGVIGVIELPLKLIVEVVISSLIVITGILGTFNSIASEKMSLLVHDEHFILQLGKKVVGTCCFEMTSVRANTSFESGGQPVYNSAMLLALRAGMSEGASMAYEAGVVEESPFLRIFITEQGESEKDVRESLKREATRAEAILLSTLDGVELFLLRDDDLKQAVQRLAPSADGSSSIEENRKQILLNLEGDPHVTPAVESSQIGTFLATLLKQELSASFTCIFSRASSKTEKKKLEKQWKSIRTREKNKDDSLADQAAKRQLVDRYQGIYGDTSWFRVTAFIHSDMVGSDRVMNALKGLALSIWGGEGTLTLNEIKIKGRTAFRLLTRRHLKAREMHATQLSAFVNTPVQHLPKISSVGTTTLPVPPQELVDHELVIGKTIFGNRKLNDVGLQVSWLCEHVAVLGATGTGKTTLVKHLISELSSKTDVPWWIFDVKGSEYKDLLMSSGTNGLLVSPGLDKSFVIDIMNPEDDSRERHAHFTFSILRELLKERSASSELTPAMERLLREAIFDIVTQDGTENSVRALTEIIEEKAKRMDERVGRMTCDALLNRLEILTREPLGSILAGGRNSVKISSLMDRRVVFDLRYVSSTGGMEAARMLYNLVAKRIFDHAMRRGLKQNLHHVVVLEEANNLVPESYTRDSAADVTTGESMVMLQRATGQGVVVVSTRPNISSNILANTATKVSFRLPYDSEIGARFMSLDESQEKYLRVLKRGRALVVFPGTEAFEIATEPFETRMTSEVPEEIVCQSKTSSEIAQPNEAGIDSITEPEISTSSPQDRAQLFDRLGELANQVIAFLAANVMATEDELGHFLRTLDPRAEPRDIGELFRDLLSLETIEREALPLVPGGFIYTLSGKGLTAVTEVIMDYILHGLEGTRGTVEQKSSNEIVVNDTAILIIPEHIRATTMDDTVGQIRQYMRELGNEVEELIIIVRGSVAAAMLRELIDKNEEFNAVTIVSAFSSSLDSMIDSLRTSDGPKESHVEVPQETELDNERPVELIGAVHELGSSAGRAVQMRLWFGLLQDFVDLSNGCVSWDVLLEFIETTAVQSIQGRSSPMSVEDGRRALTELLADEVLIALRIGEERTFIDLESGLWVVNSSILEDLKNKAIELLEDILEKQSSQVFRGHEYYDLCAGGRSYVVFPTQQQLTTLLHLHSDIACRKCNSTEVVCILTASEYVDDSHMAPKNLTLTTVADGKFAMQV